MLNNSINKRIMKQITNSIMMIKPVGFRYNEQTAVNNYYQKVLDDLTPDKIQENALREFNVLVEKLQSIGVNVVVIEDDKATDTPDSIFPNNWVSFHNDGMVGLYPMCAENRRDERREDIFDILVDEYSFAIEGIKDFTEFEDHDKFLEGTGSMVLDRENKIYHTNVMMCVGETFSVICLDTIDNAIERENVIETLQETRKEIIEITEAQSHRFAGNMLQVMGNKPCIVMSSSAYSSLTDEQKEKIEKNCPILCSSLDTIEACGGGSARCMMAEIFLPKQK